MVHDQISASAFPSIPLFWTEWNVPGKEEARDTAYAVAALANTIPQCDGHVAMMSWWTFDDVFEEQGVVRKPFHGGFGLIAAGGIKKPTYYGFALLHKLGDERLPVDSPDVLVTRRHDGTIVVAAWNLVEMDETGTTRKLRLNFRGVARDAKVIVNRIDEAHSNPLATYKRMGEPQYPTRAQIEKLNVTSKLQPTEASLRHGAFELELQPNTLVVLEISK
jgi:xylan 1,4-beta-xylosidase